MDLTQADTQHRPIRIAVEKTDEHLAAGLWQSAGIDPAVGRCHGERQPEADGFLRIGLRRWPQPDLDPAAIVQFGRLPGRAQHLGWLIARNAGPGVFERRTKFR
ncbi:hypothetical protein D3C84_673180 [compost metagenome]